MIHKELSLGRIPGPFKSLPFDNFVISPLGLVPKKETGKYRIIHDLSFSKSDYVNLFISDAEATVQYESLDYIVKIVKMDGQFSMIAKTNIEEVFWFLPMHPGDYHLLGFSLGNNAYYYDKCLPVGLKLSCSYFEKLSCALQWIMVNNFSCPFTHLFVNQWSSSSILTYISALSYINKLSASEDNTTHCLVKKSF